MSEFPRPAPVTYETRDVGRFYTHGMVCPRGTPVVSTARTWEMEPPYRQGRGLGVRVSRRTVRVFGRWGNPDPELGCMLRGELDGEGADDPIRGTGADLRGYTGR